MSGARATDIQDRADLHALVVEFYRRLLADPRIAHLFAHLDLEVHLPILVDFWALIVLGEQGYLRNAFQKHVPLAIEDHHFDVWLEHWSATVADRHSGPRADLARERARSIAALFRSKLRAPRDPGTPTIPKPRSG